MNTTQKITKAMNVKSEIQTENIYTPAPKLIDSAIELNEKIKKEEIWKDIKGYEGSYQVSDLGRVRSLDRIASIGRKLNGKTLSLITTHYGYLVVNLSLNGKVKTLRVHQLVAIAFLKHNTDDFMIVVDHIDNNKLNNKLENLQVITQRENLSKDRIGVCKYTGVTFSSKRCKYIAQCWHNNKKINLGGFETALEASKAYNNYIKKIQ